MVNISVDDGRTRPRSRGDSRKFTPAAWLNFARVETVARAIIYMVKVES